MHFLVAYDIATESKEGRRRLRHIAQACLDFGQRVQYSVFECTVGEPELALLRTRLLDIIKPDEDSLRIYRLPADLATVEAYGRDRRIDFEGPLIV